MHFQCVMGIAVKSLAFAFILSDLFPATYLIWYWILQTSEFCFCSFQIFWHTVKLISPHMIFIFIKTCFYFFAFFLISTMYFEKVMFYFFTSNPAFSQAYVLRIRTSFSPAETSFTALSFALSATIFFSATCLRRRLSTRVKLI